jgi:hypothetical protein
MQINATTTTTKQGLHRNKMTKPQTNTFPKYCKDNIKKFEYTHIIQGPYNRRVGKNSCTYYESF